MAAHNELGQAGETAATQYLLERDYHILERNWRAHPHEVDIIADDFGEIVWDEFLGVWLVLAYLPPALWTRWGTLPCYLAAFLLFRLFDITKPPPIRQIDRHTPGGLGIMLDDVLAAGYALAALWLAAAVL